MSIVGASKNQRAISPEEIHAIARKFNPLRKYQNAFKWAILSSMKY
jgi:hypothetical protein